MGLNPAGLPDFPWDQLTPYVERAAQHPDGAVVLSVGTPVDPTPDVVRVALTMAANSPGYPSTHGTPQLREAVADWFSRRRGAPGVDPDAVLPTLGSKEFVAWLPALLGLGGEHTVVIPRVAYPTYDVGARLAGARTLATDDISDWEDDSSVALVWVNSPSNPTGAVASREYLAQVVAAARRLGAVVASDECYAEMAWQKPYAEGGVPSLLDPAVCGSSHDGLLVAYSLSKQSNLAGYRAAFAAGDRSLMAALLEARKHTGMIMPGPVQAAMLAALADDDHVAVQRARYAARREQLAGAVKHAGFTVDHSEAGLYLWVTRGEDAWETVGWLADRGIVVAPGTFYGPEGARHVRIGFTASDERIAAAADRLRERG